MSKSKNKKAYDASLYVPKRETKVVVSYECNGCHAYVDYTVLYDYAFTAVVQECELCGEHGHVHVEVRCPACGHTERIALNEW